MTIALVDHQGEEIPEAYAKALASTADMLRKSGGGTACARGTGQMLSALSGESNDSDPHRLKFEAFAFEDDEGQMHGTVTYFDAENGVWDTRYVRPVDLLAFLTQEPPKGQAVAREALAVASLMRTQAASDDLPPEEAKALLRHGADLVERYHTALAELLRVEEELAENGGFVMGQNKTSNTEFNQRRQRIRDFARRLVERKVSV